MADRSRGTRSAKEWGGIPSGTAALSGNATVLLGSLTFDVPHTVLRMLGSIIIGPTSAPQALDHARVAVGIGRVSTDAATLGSTAMPDPADERDYPWLYWTEQALFFAGTAVDGLNPMGAIRLEFDIRSMRKFQRREALAVVAQYIDVVGTPAITIVAAQTRVLLSHA